MKHTVIVAGAGPVGLMLATELALGGVPTIVLDRLAEPDRRAPGMAINSGTVELLDQRGLLAAVREGTMPLPASHFANLWLDQSRLFGPDERLRHEHSIIVPQWRLEQRLADRARELGVDVRRGHEVVGLRQDADGVTVDVRTPAGPASLAAAYLVGCDGVGSTVRDLAGITFPGTEPPFYGLIGDVRIASADFRPEHFGAAYSPVGGLYSATPTGPDLWRVVTSEFGIPSPDATAEVTLGELNARVQRLTGAPFTNAEPVWLGRHANPSRQADRYRAGRVFVAGDAAHVFYALNGQRLSTGFSDAVNLGWKLAATLRGWAPADLLDSYHAERHPAGRWALVNVKAQEALIAPPEFAGPLREVFGELFKLGPVNDLLAETVQGLSARYPAAVGAGPDLLGRRLPSVPLRTPTGTTSVAELLHNGRGVLLTLTGADGPEPDLGGWCDRVDVVTADPVPELDLTAVLLRPDGHTAWVGTGSADAAEAPGPAAALAAWFGPANARVPAA